MRRGIITKNKQLYKIALLLILVSALNVGCECNKVECPDIEKSNIELTFISNGADVIFGNAPQIQVEEVIINSDTETNIPFSTFGDQIGIGLEHNKNYIIMLGELDTIQIIGLLALLDTDECCNVFEIESFEVDGQEICSSSCSQIAIELD